MNLFFQLKDYTKAASAAYTYFLKHPQDQNARHNVQMYREKFEVKDEEFVDLERKPYQVKVIVFKGYCTIFTIQVITF